MTRYRAWMPVGVILVALALGLIRLGAQPLSFDEQFTRDTATLSWSAIWEAARDTEAKVRAASEQIAVKAAAAEASVRSARDAARAEIEAVAVDAAQDMVARLANISVERDAAAAAVKAELHV